MSKKIDIKKHSQQIIELRKQGLFLPDIAKKIGISDRTISTWLCKGKKTHDDDKDTYFLFFQSFTRETETNEVLKLEKFDKGMDEMAADKPEHNKYMDTFSRVFERRNRLNGGNQVNVNVVVKQKFTGW